MSNEGAWYHPGFPSVKLRPPHEPSSRRASAGGLCRRLLSSYIGRQGQRM